MKVSHPPHLLDVMSREMLPLIEKLATSFAPQLAQIQLLNNSLSHDDHLPAEMSLPLPDWQELDHLGREISELIEQNYHLFLNHKATDEKGRYVYWDKIKHKYGKHADKIWAAIKINRLLSMRQIALTQQHEFQFCVPDTMQALLHFIDKTANTYHIQSMISPHDQHILRMEEAITSAQMEGAATTRKIAKELITKRPDKPRDDYEKMIINNHRLMQKVHELKHQPLSIDLILELHRIATRDVIENQAVFGEFRQSNDIFIPDHEGNIAHQPPDFAEIPELMDAFCQFANQTHDGLTHDLFIHPVIKAIMLHFFMGYIHPFGDGNGRTARALFYWFMLKNGYDLFEYISISRLLHQSPTGYGKSYLYTERDDLDMTYFIYYQLSIIKRAIDDLQAYVQRETAKLQHFRAEIAQFVAKHGLDARQIEILQLAVNEKGKIFSAKELSVQFQMSENTARKYLKQLADLQLLAPMKSGNALVFISPADLRERLK